MNLQEKTIYALAGPYLKTRNNETHIRIVLQFGFELLKHLNAKRSIVIPAIILHDVGYSKLSADTLQQWCNDPWNYKLTKIHEMEGAKIARNILEQTHYDPELTDIICRMIGCHDTGGYTTVVEEQIMRDSDKLCRYTETAFKLDIVLYNLTLQEHYDRLESSIDEWFYLPLSKQIAREHLKILKEKIALF